LEEEELTFFLARFLCPLPPLVFLTILLLCLEIITKKKCNQFYAKKKLFTKNKYNNEQMGE